MGDVHKYMGNLTSNAIPAWKKNLAIWTASEE
jgi:hypothetical protein